MGVDTVAVVGKSELKVDERVVVGWNEDCAALPAIIIVFCSVAKCSGANYVATLKLRNRKDRLQQHNGMRSMTLYEGLSASHAMYQQTVPTSLRKAKEFL